MVSTPMFKCIKEKKRRENKVSGWVWPPKHEKLVERRTYIIGNIFPFLEVYTKTLSGEFNN